MHAVHDRPYLHGAFGDRLRHVSYFLSHVTRPCFRAGTIDLVPNNFSEMRAILADRTADPLVLAAAAPPDRHGYFSLGVNADYVGVVHRPGAVLPRGQRRRCRARSGATRSTSARSSGGSRSTGHSSRSRHRRARRSTSGSPRFVAERIPNGATIQTGIGSIPNAILSALSGHRDLGVHTELLSDGLMDLVDAGVVTGVAKQLNRTKTVGTFALGTRASTTSSTRTRRSSCGPCATSTTRGSSPRRTGSCRSTRRSPSTCSASAPARRSAAPTTPRAAVRPTSRAGRCTRKGGQGFVVLASTAKDDTISKIVAQLAPGDVVTTLKNTVDKVVTEWGVAELRGRSLRQRAAALIAIAHPAHRDRLRGRGGRGRLSLTGERTDSARRL